jgi:hypothetical protein
MRSSWGLRQSDEDDPAISRNLARWLSFAIQSLQSIFTRNLKIARWIGGHESRMIYFP